jgi:hypothetical protein
VNAYYAVNNVVRGPEENITGRHVQRREAIQYVHNIQKGYHIQYYYHHHHHYPE